jgi:hypothetical protein
MSGFGRKADVLGVCVAGVAPVLPYRPGEQSSPQKLRQYRRFFDMETIDPLIGHQIIDLVDA